MHASRNGHSSKSHRTEDGSERRVLSFDSADTEELSPEERRNRLVFFQLLGPLKKYLEDDLVQNIDINADDTIFVERFGDGVTRVPERMSAAGRETLLSYLANQEFGRSMDNLHSRLQCDLPIYGSRVQAFANPIGNWALTIRQHAKKAIPLETYIEKGIISQQHADVLDQALRDELNIGVAGAVNSGKTTFLNSLLDRKAQHFPEQRVVVVQDRNEVRVEGFPNRLVLMTRLEQAHHESNGTVIRYTYDFADALEDALRCRQDFLCWGEVRDGQSAYGLIMATNTGTQGLMTTIHSNGCLHTMYRLEELLRLNGKTPVRSMIANVFNLTVYMQRNRHTGERRVTEVAFVRGVDMNDNYIMESA